MSDPGQIAFTLPDTCQIVRTPGDELMTYVMNFGPNVTASWEVR